MSATASKPTYVIAKSDAFGDWQVFQITPTGVNLMVTAPTYTEILSKYHEGEKLFARLPSH